MAEQIIQKLGFDAGGAITTINRLNKSLTGLSKRLNTVAKSARDFNQVKLDRTFSNLSKTNAAKTLNTAAQAANKLGTNLTQAGNQGTQSLQNLQNRTKSLTLSWQTLGRIIIAQTVVRGINAITSAISGAITETRELQKRIGEIQTLARGRLGTDQNVLQGLTATAETFGFDIIDVAEAKYQELSNQVRGSAESFEFQDAAAKLARATNSSLTDSVNLLASTLNAFGEDATQSAKAAGLLFTTIDQGRIRATELANTLGRVAPLANALGIEFNEVGASLARITQGGTRADTAITQLLGILNKLSKPTTELSAAFDKLGVSSALEGIQQAGGLLNFLQRLQKVAGDNQTLVEFFNNVRAIQGVLALLGTDVDQTTATFEEFLQTAAESEEALESAFKTASQNDAVTYEKLIAKLGTTFRELATVIIPLINDALEFFVNTLNAIKSNPILTGTIIVAAAATFTTLSIAAFTATGAISGLAIATGSFLLTIAPMVIAVGAVVLAVIALNAVFKSGETKAYDNAIAAATKRLKEFKTEVEAIKASISGINKRFREGAESVRKFVDRFRDVRKAALDTVRDLNRDFVNESKNALDSVLEARKGFSSAIQNAIKTADRAIEKSTDRQTSIRQKKEDFLLNRQLDNFNDLQKAAKLFEVSRSEAFKAKDLIEGTTDLGSFDQAAGVLERRLKLAEQGLAAAKASGNRGAILIAEQQVVTALNDQINLEKQRQVLIEQRRAAAEELAKKDKAQVANLQKLVQDFQKELSILNDKGQLLNAEELDSQTEKVKKLLDRLREFALTGEQKDLAAFLGVTGLADVASEQLNQAIATIEKQRPKFQAAVNETFAGVNALIPDRIIDILINLDLTKGGPDQIRSLSEGIANARAEINNLTGASQRFLVTQKAVEKNQQLLVDLFNITGSDTTLVDNINKELLRLTTNTNTTEEEFQRFLNTIKSLSQAGTIDLGAGFDSSILQQATTQAERFFEAKKKAALVEDDTTDDRARLAVLLQVLESAEKAIEVANSVISVMQGANNATGQVTESTASAFLEIEKLPGSWNKTKTAIDRAKTAVDAYSKAIENAPAPPAGVTGVNSMFGGSRGFLFRAAGGFARGTDTIPAMLSPGEFVVNAKSSRKFASQLIAMNAGTQPIHRQEGGSVINNNVNVGDINVNGAANPDETARRVMSKIKREFRRGTASRFN